MTSTALVERARGDMVAQTDPKFWEVMLQVVTMGDLSALSPEHKTKYYRYVCESVGLPPATLPLSYIKTQGKVTLYANRNATDQLRKIHRVDVTIVSRERIQDEKGNPVVLVTARARTPDGRTDESIAAIPIGGLAGDDYCNAMMKCETKAKRRVTLSIVGLSVMDEMEAQSIAGAQRFTPAEFESPDFAFPAPPPTPLRATAQIAEPPPPPAISNVHQHAQLRTLAERGFDLGAAMRPLGVESIEDLTAEEAKELIVAGRAAIRPGAGGAATAVEQVKPDLPFQLSAQQISLFWTAGANTGWPKEEKRDALAKLYPRLVGQDGTVDIRDLSREQFDDMIALFNEEKELAFDKDGAAFLRPAGPPTQEQFDTAL